MFTKTAVFKTLQESVIYCSSKRLIVWEKNLIGRKTCHCRILARNCYLMPLQETEVHGSEFLQTFPIFQLAGGRSLRSLSNFHHFPFFSMLVRGAFAPFPKFYKYFPFFSLLVGGAFAPFPVGHPLNRLNPAIEPWWVDLEPVRLSLHFCRFPSLLLVSLSPST
jgi:hypothetical protein